MKWLIGIAAVMLVAHWYFRRGLREPGSGAPAESGERVRPRSDGAD